ncbi:hypothetical protein [Cupriavidus taiwanensis]|uniref:hypothetical protein n=1 Tax=Cupriavidus taiwanensis TaxID=164546 RepID=UPI001F11AEB7|nr:hypothetical protein [Cupriavidus taiwanensis]
MLLRYCLGDDAPSISALREKAAGAFPKGGVAAQVHVDGTAWMVYRPYGQGTSFAGLGRELEPLISGSPHGDFSDFSQALHESFIAKLPAQSLPGSNQTLEWRHLLAWCIRDQRTRFDGFFHWRDGDGLGFRRPRQDPPLFVQSVLGLLDAEGDRLIRDADAAQVTLKSLEERLSELEREPAMSLAHAEKQLRRQLEVDKSVPVFDTTLGPSLQSLVTDAVSRAEADETQLDEETTIAEDELAPLLSELQPLRRELVLRTKEKEIAKALLDANQAEYTRLVGELQELRNLAGLCRHGNVDFSACDYVVNRQRSQSLHGLIGQREVKADEQRLLAELHDATQAELSCMRELSGLEALVGEKRAAVRRLQMRKGTSKAERAYLESIWTDLESRIGAQAGGEESQELVQARAKRDAQELELNSRKAALLKRSQERSGRAEALATLTRLVATRLLGEAGHGRFVPESDERLFELAVGGEAYQVLEVLLGDITCLIDSATTVASQHPGFLVHDCPREADMSERLYREFLSMALEAGKALAKSKDAIPFQYIVTTTSPPPEELRTGNYLALTLHPGAGEHLLFKRRLTTQLPGI